MDMDTYAKCIRNFPIELSSHVHTCIVQQHNGDERDLLISMSMPVSSIVAFRVRACVCMWVAESHRKATRNKLKTSIRIEVGNERFWFWFLYKRVKHFHFGSPLRFIYNIYSVECFFCFLYLSTNISFISLRNFDPVNTRQWRVLIAISYIFLLLGPTACIWLRADNFNFN